jgi:RNA polymerase sigma-70 factor (ECF subfamily)
MENKPSEEQLQVRLRSDDKTALKEVYISYRQEFLYYAKRYPLEEADVLDIYQDAIVAMHQNFVMKQISLKLSSIKTYLFGIGKNKIYKKLKEKNKVLRVEVEIPDSYAKIDFDDSLPTENQIALAKKLNEISDACRHIIKLFYYRGLTIDDIVEITDYKDKNTVRSQKSRCLKHLKSLLKVK